MIQEVLREIEKRKKFVLTSHARPDGDAIGSTLGCCLLLREMGKEAEVVLHDAVPKIYRPLPFAEQIAKGQSVNGNYEAAIVLECDSVQRTRLQGLEQQFLINIDHHQSGKNFASVNWIDPTACAAAEMVYRLALEASVTITPEIATCLYTAVLTDTGAFSFVGTNERTFALAQKLVSHGADPVKIAQSVYFANPEAKMRLLGSALSNLQRRGNLAWMFIDRSDMARNKALEEDTEGLVNYALSIEGVEIALFFRETEDQRWRVSFRSKGEIDVAQIAERFGGGGHRCASGASIDGPLSAATSKVLNEFKRAGFGN